MRDICKNYEKDCDNSYICPCLAFENNNGSPRNKPINDTMNKNYNATLALLEISKVINQIKKQGFKVIITQNGELAVIDIDKTKFDNDESNIKNTDIYATADIFD